MNIYNEKLIQKTILCFKEENDQIISRKTAIEYLDSLGGLFLAFCKK